MTIEEIIFALKEYETLITKLELKNHVLRQENERLKKELDMPETETDESPEKMEKLTIHQIADIIDKEDSPEIMMKCLIILLNEDKHKGQKTSPIISKIINNPYLPKEGFEMIFKDIEDNAGRNKIIDKYEGRLRYLLKSRRLPQDLCDEIAKYYIKKTLQRYSNTEYSITRLKNFAETTPKYVKEKINELINRL